MATQAKVWGDPGVAEQMEIQETTLQMPTTTGGQVTRTLQRSGLLKKLRFYFQTATNVTVFGAAGTKSVYGPLGSGLHRLRVEANGQIPLADLSGLGLAYYTEIQNRDGSVLATPPYLSAIQTNVAGSADLVAYPAQAAAAEYKAQQPAELQFALPVNIGGQVSELGLWLLQNQAIDLTVSATFNSPTAAAAGVEVPWSDGAGMTQVGVVADTFLQIERELYTIPTDPRSYPNLRWAHQIIEYTVPFIGNFSRFPIPRAGLLLRAAVINLDGSNLPVENTDVASMNFMYGSNETPIARPGIMYNEEYLMDYNRVPPKGLCLLDFYKWGEQGLKLVKDTEVLANLRIESTFTATATGTQKIILDRLIPVAAR